MGMEVGGTRGVAAEPNVVPLIDVLLVLIIIFLMITPQVPTGLPTIAPQPAPLSSKMEHTDTIVVQVMQGGKILINRDPTDWNMLGARLADIFKNRADKVAFVRGANQVPFGEIARVIDIMRGAGIEHVGLMPAAGTNPTHRRKS